jgi:opacity protein-like surface antigen
MRQAVFLMAAVMLIGVGPASAQDQKLNISIGGGATFPIDEIGSSFGTGSNFDIGVNVNLTENIGLRFDYFFTGMSEGIDVELPSQPIEPGRTHFNAHHRVHSGLFDIVVSTTTRDSHFYVLGGGGIYNRSVELTSPSVGLVPGFCDPFWYVCYPPILVPVEEILGSRSSTDFGINVGAGFVFRVAESFGVFIETRYHFIWGPEIAETNPLNGSGRIENANGQYFPLTFGIRF